MNMKTKVDYLKKFSRVQLTNIFLASGSILPVPSTSSSSSSSSSFISSTVVSTNAAAAAASAAEAMRIAAKLSSSLSSLTPSQPSLSLQSSASTDDAQVLQPSTAFSYVTSIPSGRSSSSSSTSSTAGPGSQPSSTTSTQRRNRWGPAQSSSSVSAAEPDIEQVVATFSSSDSSYDDEVQQPSLATIPRIFMKASSKYLSL